MKEQLVALLYKKQGEVFLNSDGDESDFMALVWLIEDGTIDSFEELAEYGVKE